MKGQRPGVLPALAFAAHYPLDTGFTKRLFRLTLPFADECRLAGTIDIVDDLVPWGVKSLAALCVSLHQMRS